MIVYDLQSWWGQPIPKNTKSLCRIINNTLKKLGQEKDIYSRNYVKAFTHHDILCSINAMYYKWGSVKGKYVLDIGCGSDTVFGLYSNGKEDYYIPWKDRVLHELGAYIVGVDKGIMNELFEHHQADIIQDNELIRICNGRKFDIAFCLQVGSIVKFRDNNKDNEKRLYYLLAKQLESVLKPDGIFVQDMLTESQSNN